VTGPFSHANVFHFHDPIGPVYIRNNIILNNASNQSAVVSYRFDTATDMALINTDYNVLSDSVSVGSTVYSINQWRQWTGLDNHSIIGVMDPERVWSNPIGMGGDYHLKFGSPAIAVGEDISAVLFDADGNPRSQGNVTCIGAYEYLKKDSVMTAPSHSSE